MTVLPRDEQEVILSWDKELGEWHYYGDDPVKNRKWRDLVDADRIEIEPTGKISVLEGTVTGVVIISKKRESVELTPEQAKAVAERMRAIGKANASEKA